MDLKDKQRFRSEMIRETLIDAMNIARSCESKFHAADYNNGINTVIDKLYEAWLKEYKRYEESQKQEN